MEAGKVQLPAPPPRLSLSATDPSDRIVILNPRRSTSNSYPDLPEESGSVGGSSSNGGQYVLAPSSKKPVKFGPKYASLLLVMFSVYVGRLLIVPLWSIDHVPFISPVYKQGEHWLETSTKTAGALLHIVFGLLLLAAGLHQVGRDYVKPEDDAENDFNTNDMIVGRDRTSSIAEGESGMSRCSQIREQFHAQFEKVLDVAMRNNRVHKWVGRCYVLCGLICLGSLQLLLPSLGQGASDSPNLALIIFVQVSILTWLFAVITGIVCIWKGRVTLHRQLMKLSYAVALIPLSQRYFHIFFLPITLLIVSIFSDTWPGSNDLVWSMTGYGRADQAVLTVTSWCGFFTNILLWYAFK